MINGIKVFSDAADILTTQQLIKKFDLDGVTTNPTLIKKSGVKDYTAFCKEIIHEIPNLPLSIEVISDDFDEMKAQALKIASWGANVFVKIPIVNTKNENTQHLIKELNQAGVQVNVTAILTQEQIDSLRDCFNFANKAIISIFCGRIADTGRDPAGTVKYAKNIFPQDHVEILWASCREVFNIYQAAEINCDIITVPNDIINKISLYKKDLSELSLETVKMFHDDAKSSGYKV